MQIGRVDLLKSYGGGLSLTATGDLAIVQDSFTSPAATIQRIEHLIQTNPRIKDASGNFVTTPDDLFNPDWGGGSGTIVGEMVTDSLTHDIASRLQSALASDPYIAISPAPSISVTNVGGGFIQIDVSCSTISGQLVTVPSQKLSVLA